MSITAILNKLLDKHDLSAQEMREVMTALMAGELSDAQIAGFLIALRCKGESIAEIVEAVRVMRELAHGIDIYGEHVIDTCGTGGDGANTFNISTAAAFVVAAAGAKVAKHGNRSVSSRSGSADVLEAAGVNLHLSPEQAKQCVDTIGIGFLFASNHHSAVRYSIPARKQLGVRTLFNLLGPLANPANAQHQLIGVFAKAWLLPVAEVLKQLGSKHVLVVHAQDGLDEISIAAATDIAELKNGEIQLYSITPEQFAFARADLSSLAISDAQHSLAMIQAVLANQAGPARDIVALNAGAGIYAADLTANLAEGIDLAQRIIASGAAANKLSALVDFSRQFV